MAARSIHVLPQFDLRAHDSDEPTGCPCHPRTLYVGAGAMVVVHNAYDKRELRDAKAVAA